MKEVVMKNGESIKFSNSRVIKRCSIDAAGTGFLFDIILDNGKQYSYIFDHFSGTTLASDNHKQAIALLVRLAAYAINLNLSRMRVNAGKDFDLFETNLINFLASLNNFSFKGRTRSARPAGSAKLKKQLLIRQAYVDTQDVSEMSDPDIVMYCADPANIKALMKNKDFLIRFKELELEALRA